MNAAGAVAAGAAGIFGRKRKDEEETALVFSFDDAPKISVTNADDFFQGSDDNPLGMEREHQTEGEANNILPRVC